MLSEKFAQKRSLKISSCLKYLCKLWTLCWRVGSMERVIQYLVALASEPWLTKPLVVVTSGWLL